MRLLTSSSNTMNFITFSEYLSRIESVTSRKEMTSLLSELIGKCDGDEIAIVCYLLNARVAPLFVPIEFNVADKTLRKALESVVRSSSRSYDVSKGLRMLGDPGSVVEEIKLKYSEDRGETLSVAEVYGLLWDIAVQEGIGSSESRQNIIVALIKRLRPIEAKYAMRVLSQRLRLGAGSKTILDALSLKMKGNKGDREDLERAYGVCADLGYIAQVYMNEGTNGLRKIGVTPGVPVLPMLVDREKNASNIMKRMRKAIVQPKYDGIRCQIHIGVGEDKKMDDRIWWKRWKERNSAGELTLFRSTDSRKDVRLFSRNLEDMTNMFPEVVEEARKLDVASAVFDSEVVGFNDATDEYVAFQETMTRKRKYHVQKQVSEMPVKAFVFDLIYKNGKDLLLMKNKDRIEEMGKVVDTRGLIRVTSSQVVTSAKALQKVFETSVSEGLEGVVVKDVSTIYEPGVRGLKWLKLKRAFQGHLADTIDVVVLGYYFGRGKQASLGIGAFLGGVFDNDTDTFVTVAKVGGIKEQQWIAIKNELDGIAVDSKPMNVSVKKSLWPDVWVFPKVVATVEADEITRSPIHTAGADENDVGFGLRFPRMKVWGRDKVPEDATSVEELKKMFKTSGSKSAHR